MKSKRELSLAELAGWVCSSLDEKGFKVVLSGGACASIYSNNKYQSYDLDFIRIDNSSFEEISKAMIELGFKRQGRNFLHPNSKFFVEFPQPPLTVGEETVKNIREINIPNYGRLSLLTPTDCIKDRLCGFYFWNDKQCLDQALLVGWENEIDLGEIKRWSTREKMRDRFEEFRLKLEATRSLDSKKKKKPKS